MDRYFADVGAQLVDRPLRKILANTDDYQAHTHGRRHNADDAVAQGHKFIVASLLFLVTPRPFLWLVGGFGIITVCRIRVSEFAGDGRGMFSGS
jgi:hypothetical protein